jgi:hypothetical protein
LDPWTLQESIRAICTMHPELATNAALRPDLPPAVELQRMNGVLIWLAQQRYATNQASQFRRLLEVARGARTPAEMVNRLNEYAPNLDTDALEQLIHVITAGGPEALRALEAIPPDRFGAGGAVWEDARSDLRLRLGLPPAQRVFAGVDDRLSGQWWFGSATEAQIAGWRKELVSLDENKFAHGPFVQESAFMRMTVHDPAGVVDWLLSLEPEFSPPQGGSDASLLAAYFADYCRTNRDESLRRLLAARNPSVRAIAAATLADSDAKAALPVLRAMRERPDGPGNLANLELARRGDKQAMEHLLQLLPAPLTSAPAARSSFAWPVADEAQALLSNSAKASGLPQPEGDFAAWWNAHRAEVKLGDPWLVEEALMKR